MKQLTTYKDLPAKVFAASDENFEALALDVFRFQYAENSFYREYCDTLGRNIVSIDRLEQIPFLPIQFFKSKEIKTGNFIPAVVFESSGTTGSVNSKHYLKDTAMYEESFQKAFRVFYGEPKGKCILGLLPSYLERQHSSLVWMVKELIEQSGHPKSGFYLYNHETLHETLKQNENAGQPTLLIGVTYALLDFFEQYPMQLNHTIVMETGGMKGRKAELTRSAVHKELMQGTGLTFIHSEYGMTELLSQAYSKKDGIFKCPPWMRILLRAEDDPFDILLAENTGNQFASGVINVIDLANIYSCSFIATDDMGRLYKDGSFEVLGRLDNSDIRGCSLMLP